MKKFKLLPNVLMLVMCVSILAVGIYAASPAKNDVMGTILVKASGLSVTVSVYKDSVLPANLIGTGTTIDVNNFSLDTSTAGTTSEAPTLKLIVVFSTTSSDSLIVDTETIEYFNGLTETTNKTINDAMMVSKVHTPGQTDSATGLASFTNGKDYQIECNFNVTELQDETYNVSFDLEFYVSKASEYVQQRYASARPSDKNSVVGINGVDYMYFGEYPQTRLTDTTIINRLTSTGEYFETYDIEGGNEIYSDATTGNRYVKIADVQENSDSGLTSTGEAGYFLIEPIKWNILSQENGEVYLLSDIEVEQVKYRKNYNSTKGTVLDTDGNVTSVSAFFATDSSGNLITDKNGYNIYANNYEYSDLRAYLNDTFYNQAFNDHQKSLILKTTVKNDTTTTNTTTNPYTCADTEDYIFAPSYQDLINSNYKFVADANIHDLNRMLKVSEYAGATGAYVYSESSVWSLMSKYGLPTTKDGVLTFLMNSGLFATTEKATDYYDEYVTRLGRFWLRSPYYNSSHYACYSYLGAIDVLISVSSGNPGCVPALRLSLAG